jgi:hypothetical protein
MLGLWLGGAVVAWMGIPAKLNAFSEGKPNGIPGYPEHHRSVATLATRL